MLEIEHHRRLSIRIRSFDTHPPRTVRRRAVGAQIAAEIDEEGSLFTGRDFRL